MIMTIVESGGAHKLPRGSSVAVFAMLFYVLAASIAAGAGNLGSGLLVLAMGAVVIALVDYVMWRDVAKEGAATTLGPYVLAGEETGPEILRFDEPGHFEAVRTEAPVARVVAPAAEPSEAQPVPPAANDPGAGETERAEVGYADADPVETGGGGTIEAVAEPVVEHAQAVAEEPASVEARADAVGTRPPALAAPREAGADDLKSITGIGPANEAKLNALGIYHLDQIAAWDEANTRWVGAYLSFPGRIEREDWVGQARLLTQQRASA